jgi:hypothetical protein
MDKIKYICLNDFIIERHWSDLKDFYKKDEVYCFANPINYSGDIIKCNYFNYNLPENFWLTDTELYKYFIPLCEFREKRINNIFLN